jgi:hypothetical protein
MTVDWRMVGANVYGTQSYLYQNPELAIRKTPARNRNQYLARQLAPTRIPKLHTPSSAELYKATGPFKPRTLSSFFSNFPNDLSHTQPQPTPGTIPDQFPKSIPTSPTTHQLVNATTMATVGSTTRLASVLLATFGLMI